MLLRIFCRFIYTLETIGTFIDIAQKYTFISFTGQYINTTRYKHISFFFYLVSCDEMNATVQQKQADMLDTSVLKELSLSITVGTDLS